ncbi:MAG: carbohydrate kinase family protein [Proteobacteria bacterium]|nr:carbohydrate kinase family protein [Pseudomonadota bacterium]
MTRIRAVTTGFATVDYAIELAEQFDGTGTRTVKHTARDAWPRAGGAALYACRQLVRAGIAAAPVTWIGSDAGGECYEAVCREEGIPLTGVRIRKGGTTATCFLIYQPDGDYGCLFQPPCAEPRSLASKQRELLAGAEFVLIAVGPPALSGEILATISPQAIVAWVAKTDLTAYPQHVRNAYARRADYIFCNAGEREFVDASFDGRRASDQVIVETRGGEGVLIDTGDRRLVVPVAESIETPDTTGAGDTLAGGTMASILTGESNLEVAVAAGIARSAELLRSRRP